MKADNAFNVTGHNRTIRISEIPDAEIREIDITVNYTGHGNAGKSVVLDRIIIPQIMKGLRLAELFSHLDISEMEDLMLNDLLKRAEEMIKSKK